MTVNSIHRSGERGAISGLQIAVIGLTVLVLGLGSFGIWAYVAYSEAQSDVDGKIAIAVADAREKKGEEDEIKFAEREKQPSKTLKAPDDYCGLTFQYPKTWSEFWSEQITNGGDFKAYLNPGIVPPVTSSQQYAVRVIIEQKDYDQVIAQYENLVTKGDLKSSTSTSEGKSGTRLTGNFSSKIRGDAVIYRCRDKTITVRTDADTFKNDFESIIRTIDFNS
ncbi:MAG: hypothetical protein WAW80_02190 [Candidatus Saccharimonadales bacterium]